MKKILALLLVLAMVFALAACGGGAKGAGFDITVWVPEKAVELTQQQIADFNSSNEYGIKFNATVEPVSEADAATNMITDVEAGGDIYFFAQDQFARLVQAGALNKLGTEAAAAVSAANDAGVVLAATSGSELFAYPLTSDNGYFMYYDKAVIPEDDVDSLEALIADCASAGKYIAFVAVISACYLASCFLATGCVSEWTTGDDGSFISVKDTFDSPEGLIAAKGMKKLVDSPIHLSSSKGTEFGSGAAVVVTGIWDFETVKGILGDNMGVTDLPSFEVDGQSYHLGSFNGCKLLGVKPQQDAEKGAALHLLAQYLTGEKAQMERFEKLSWGPSNSVDQASDAVQANPGLAALFKQAPYSVPQGQIHGSWWDIAKVIADDVKDATDDAGLQAALDNYYNKIASLFTMTEEEKNAWGVIGTVEGTNWDTDFPMTEAEPGVFKSAEINLFAGNEFKCRQGASWDVNYGSDGSLNGPNVVVEEDGLYIVTLTITDDGATGTITLEKVGEPTSAAPVVEKTAEELNAWGVIGAICGTNWDTDFPMTEVAPGVFESNVLELKAGDELKCRQGGDWAVNFPADNVKVEEDGTYVVVLDVTDETVVINPAEHRWGVVGSFNDWGGSADLEMTEVEEGVFESDAANFAAGTELKVRQDSDWTVNYGADGPDGANLKVEEDGSYVVRLDLAAGTVELIKR